MRHGLSIAREIRDQAYALATLSKRTTEIRGIRLSLAGISPRMRYVMTAPGRSRYEEDDAELASQILTADDRVLEVGGGVGFLALHCIKTLGIRDYFMVEANRRLLASIETNFALNGTPPPQVLQAVVNAKDQPVEFWVHRNFWSSSLARRHGSKREMLEGRSIPSILAEMPFHPNVLLMDIEGAEADIPLSHFEPFEKILIELHPKLAGSEGIDALLNGLSARGFEIAARKGGSHAFIRS